MARSYWVHSVEELPHATVPLHGCQATDCTSRATHQWQRYATEEEMAAEAATQGQYGSVFRNHTEPSRVAVFACKEHLLHPDSMVRTHEADCVAPDDGCACHDSD